jgi:hypothetical protein
LLSPFSSEVLYAEEKQSDQVSSELKKKITRSID